MRTNIDLLQDISTNGKFDYVVMAQDWDCSSQETLSGTIISSTFTWKFNKDDELCEGLDYDLISFGTCQQVRKIKFPISTLILLKMYIQCIVLLNSM